MAGTLVGGAFLSSALNVLFDRLASKEFIDFFKGQSLDSHLLQKLETTLLQLEKVLNDAEDKQITNPKVKAWLDKLKGAIYDAEDLVDEIATEALRSKVEAEYPRAKQSLRDSLISPFTRLVDPRSNVMNSKLEEMIGMLDVFLKAKDLLGLREVAGQNWSQTRLPTTSLVVESSVYGRETDKEKIMEMLLSDGEGSNELDVIPVVGMGGVGKTTLAQLLYNDGKVNAHFDKKAWVCVSDKFDVLSITITIVEKVTGGHCNAKDLDSLHVKLKESLSGKKFLIVLDDVWHENPNHWDVLMAPFKFGAHGSKIIVTTRNGSVASIVRTVPNHGLQELPEEDGWKLFSKHAFEKGYHNANPELEGIGKEIVKKCRGLPLAIKTLGHLLRSQRDPKDWNNILESAIWELPEEKSDILPALRLSYHYLPSHLKRCFASCSIIYKDYEFDMDELVSIWRAEGFLEKHKNNKTVEEEGYECFRELLSRSFFQRSNTNDSFYVMHDLVHDLAQHVMGDFYYRLEDGNVCDIAEKVRYFSFARSEFGSFEKFKEIMKVKCLRTFLPLKHKYKYGGHLSEKAVHEILPRLTRLRLLSLSKFGIRELPHSISNLIHLRFLDLSNTKIQELPESVCKLYNLETLLLIGCYLLTALPADLVKLISLRHLDLKGTYLKEMPMNISRLKDLQGLTVFVVGKYSGTGINELKELHSLRGSITITGLENVTSGDDALEAKLKEKKHVEELAFEWGSSTTEDLAKVEKVTDVLVKLEPHTHLKRLRIKNYGGTKFPNWLGHQSFDKMKSLRLDGCECFSLPPLGQLPSLRKLTIARMPNIQNVGHEFYGESGSSRKPFQSLETLRFENMSGWEEWCILDAGEFSGLQNLELIKCPELIRGLPTNVPSLVRLDIVDCPKLEASLSRTTSIQSLVLMQCQGVQLEWQRVSSLRKLKISGFENLKEFACELVTLTNLEELVVEKSSLCVPKSEEILHCSMFLEKLTLLLKSLPLGLFPELRSLRIWNCRDIGTLLIPDRIVLQNLTSLEIYGCDDMLTFPCGGLSAPNLSYLNVNRCRKLKALPEQMHTLLPSLESLHLWKCPEIESFPEGGLPSKLGRLVIWDCDKLVHGRRDWGLQTLTSLTSFGVSGVVLESFPDEGLLPPTLTSLHIRRMQNPKSLNERGLQPLVSLKRMLIETCPQLQSLPEEGLPTSLSELVICKCPLLKPRLCKEEGEDWHKIAHIPLIRIDGEVISD